METVLKSSQIFISNSIGKSPNKSAIKLPTAGITGKMVSMMPIAKPTV